MGRSLQRTHAAPLHRIAQAVPPDAHHIRHQIMVYIRGKPHLDFSTQEIADHFKLTPTNAWYHLKLLISEGAVEKVSGKKRYQARAGYMTLDQKRQAVKDGTRSSVVLGEDWAHGAQPSAIAVRPHFKFREMHLASIRSRMERADTLFVPQDLEAFDDVIQIVFPKDAHQKG
jgi:hypothetical protein